MKSVVFKIRIRTICMLLALHSVNLYAQSSFINRMGSFTGLNNLKNNHDSAYVLVAQHKNKTFVFKIHNKMSLLYFDTKEKTQKKIKGEIVSLSDTSVTIYKVFTNEQIEFPIKNIVRFSRANRSLLRYVAIIGFVSIVEAAIAVAQNKAGENNMGTSASIALVGMGFDGYAFIPALFCENYRKHYINKGWELNSVKYPYFIVHALKYRE